MFSGSKEAKQAAAQHVLESVTHLDRAGTSMKALCTLVDDADAKLILSQYQIVRRISECLYETYLTQTRAAFTSTGKEGQ